jgi:hypothetical protein
LRRLQEKETYIENSNSRFAMVGREDK